MIRDVELRIYLKRVVEPELLDGLPSTDSRAIRSRRDLRRVNAWMGNACLLASILNERQCLRPVRRVVDLGAGDGSFMLKLAKRLARDWPSVEVILLDRQDLVDQETLEEFSILGWNATPVRIDLWEWLEEGAPPELDLVVANLFLHHFSDDRLRVLLRQIAGRTRTFVSCDPRRSVPALIGANLLWMVGCNAVTRHDGVISVHAGFTEHELSELWPREAGWRLQERKAGLFGHCFLAEQAGENGCGNDPSRHSE